MAEFIKRTAKYAKGAKRVLWLTVQAFYWTFSSIEASKVRSQGVLAVASYLRSGSVAFVAGKS